MVFENGANSQQIEYLHHRLEAWRSQLVYESGEGACHLDKGNTFGWMGQAANVANRDASSHSLQDRRQKLIRKIDETLQQIEARSYRL